MKLPRDVSGEDLAKRLSILGYAIMRQSGSHIRLTTDRPSEFHVTIPKHDPLKIGTLNSILHELCEHHRIERDRLIELLFG